VPPEQSEELLLKGQLSMMFWLRLSGDAAQIRPESLLELGRD